MNVVPISRAALDLNDGPRAIQYASAVTPAYASEAFGGDFEESDAGVGGLFGFRVALPRSLVLRADGALDYVPSPANGAGDNWIAGVQVGVGVAFGNP
jgi:hypothetical protein